MGWYNAVLCALVLVPPVAPGVGNDRAPLPDNPYVLDPHRACGCYCLKFLDAAFGGQTEYNQIARMCSPGPQGVTFDRIRDVAVGLGYYARPVKATLDQLRQVASPAIIHLDKADGPDHYVVWLGWDARHAKAYVFSPPVMLDYQDLDALADYSGNAMIVSNKPIPDSITVTDPLTPGQIALNVIGISVLLVAGVYVCRFWLRFRISRSACLPVILCVGSSIAGCGGSDTASKAVPVDTPRDVSLGEIDEDTDLKYTFVAKNRSQLPLRILSLDKSCNCQAVGIEVGQTIDPQCDLSVPYHVPNDGSPGWHAGRIKITTDSNDESLREITFALRARVQAKIRAVPAQIAFGIVYDGEEPTKRQIRLESELPGVIERFDKAECSRGLVRTTVASTSAGVIVFDVSLADDIPHGDVKDTITFSFRGKSDKPVIVDVRVKRVGAIQVIPNSLAWDSSGSFNQRVRLKSSSGKPFRVTKVDLPSYCSADLPSKEPGAVQEVTIQFSPSLGDKGTSECTFYTDITENPVRVPVRVH